MTKVTVVLVTYLKWKSLLEFGQLRNINMMKYIYEVSI